MKLKVQPLNEEAFAPFGQVLIPLAQPGRVDDMARLENRREAADPMLSIIRVEPKALPLDATVMERHPHSTQTFVPLAVRRYLIVVAPHAGDGGPDMTKARAFVAEGRQGISYNADTWHHGLTVLDGPADFAVFMWNDGGPEDTEFVDLAGPVTILP